MPPNWKSSKNTNCKSKAETFSSNHHEIKAIMLNIKTKTILRSFSYFYLYVPKILTKALANAISKYTIGLPGYSLLVNWNPVVVSVDENGDVTVVCVGLV